MSAHKPSWFTDGKVIVSNAPTCGVNKDGHEQYKVDPLTGIRSETEIDDQLMESVVNIIEETFNAKNVFLCTLDEVLDSGVYVPQYHDYSSKLEMEEFVKEMPGFELKTLGELRTEGKLLIREGHGSPSLDQRIGDVPYIKVSDIRAGHININSSNLIPIDLAVKYWRGSDSRLEAYDLISPKRASKNIGEFCVLMPGQEKVVLTKEVIIIRSNDTHLFDQFYLMWALSLNVVRKQWNRIVLMQTNREDVGDRIFEIIIPVPKNRKIGEEHSQHFRNYYNTIFEARRDLINGLNKEKFQHNFFLA